MTEDEVSLVGAVTDLVGIGRRMLRWGMIVGPILALLFAVYVVDQHRTRDAERRRFDASEQTNAKLVDVSEVQSTIIATALKLTNPTLTPAERAQVRANLDRLLKELERRRAEVRAAQESQRRAGSSPATSSLRGAPPPVTTRRSPATTAAPRQGPGQPPGTRPLPTLPAVPGVPSTVLDPVLRPVCSITRACTAPS